MARAEGGLVVGADGGGTRLRLTLADAEGRVLARREGPPALLGAGRDEEVIRGLEEGVRGLLDEADAWRPPAAAPPIAALCAGLAGGGSAEARAGLEEALRSAGTARRVRVLTDAGVALLDAFPEGPGILLVSGTGSIAVARDAQGRTHRTGGWGALLGDEGSGYALGLAGLRAAVRGLEGRGPRTDLAPALLAEIAAADLAEALAWTQHAAKDGIAALAPRVAVVAEAGDPVAGPLVEGAVDALRAHVHALRVAAPHARVALSGGLLAEGGGLWRPTAEALAAEGLELRLEPVEGVRGALRQALRMVEGAAGGRRDAGPA